MEQNTWQMSFIFIFLNYSFMLITNLRKFSCNPAFACNAINVDSKLYADNDNHPAEGRCKEWGIFREKKANLNDVSDVSEAGWEVSQE